jgi:hypothetical protein
MRGRQKWVHNWTEALWGKPDFRHNCELIGFMGKDQTFVMSI